MEKKGRVRKRQQLEHQESRSWGLSWPNRHGAGTAGIATCNQITVFSMSGATPGFFLCDCGDEIDLTSEVTADNSLTVIHDCGPNTYVFVKYRKPDYVNPSPATTVVTDVLATSAAPISHDDPPGAVIDPQGDPPISPIAAIDPQGDPPLSPIVAIDPQGDPTPPLLTGAAPAPHPPSPATSGDAVATLEAIRAAMILTESPVSVSHNSQASCFVRRRGRSHRVPRSTSVSTSARPAALPAFGTVPSSSARPPAVPASGTVPGSSARPPAVPPSGTVPGSSARPPAVPPASIPTPVRG